MKIKLKDKYKKDKKYLDEKSQNFYPCLQYLLKWKKEKEKHYCFLFDIK